MVLLPELTQKVPGNLGLTFSMFPESLSFQQRCDLGLPLSWGTAVILILPPLSLSVNLSLFSLSLSPSVCLSVSLFLDLGLFSAVYCCQHILLPYFQGRMTYTADGSSFYDGEWVDNVRHGFGLRQYASQNVYEGTWWKNRRHGEGSMRWLDRNQMFTGQWHEGVQVMSSSRGYGKPVSSGLCS